MKLVLLGITNYGWVMIVLLVLSVWVAVKILKRNNRNTRPGCLGIGYVSLIAFCLFSLSATLAGMLGSFIMHAFTLPRYEARVVGLRSYEDTDSRNRRTAMYQPLVAFVMQDGTPVTIKTDIASSGKREMNAVITVGYKRGMASAEELSGNKYILIGGAAVMLLLMVYFALGGIAYALGWRMQPFFRFDRGLLFFFVFPLAMLFLLGVMSYAVILYFTGQKPDMPVWAVAMCSFFSLILLLAFLGYVRTLAGRT